MSKSRIKARQRESRFGRATLIVVFGSLVLLTWFALTLFDKYNDTKVWETTRLNTEYATVAPLFARNYVDETMIKDIEELSNLSKLITKIESNTGLTRDDRKAADETIKNAEKIISQYENIPSELTTQLETIILYRDIYDFLEIAYSKPNSETLSNLMGRLTTLSLSDARDVHKVVMNNLSVIADQYAMVHELVHVKLPELVEVKENRVLMLDTTSQAKTNSLLEYINHNDLIKFDVGSSISKLLKSKTWTVALKNNDNYVKWTNWQTFENAIKNINLNQYIKRETVKTYTEVTQFPNATIYGLVEKEGYDILTSSTVKKITYGGVELSNDTLIHINAPIEITIQPEYQKIEVEEKEETKEETKEEETKETSTEKSSTENSSTETMTDEKFKSALDAQIEELINNINRNNN